MSDDMQVSPLIWSRSISRLPQEDKIEQLEELLQQRDLSFWDDAEALREYIDRTGVSQAVCAKRLGRSQAAVGNRLRILKLSEPVRERMRGSALTERHARALLRLNGEEARHKALDAVITEGMNVSQTEAYVDRILEERDAASEETFQPLITELEKLQAGMPDIEFRLSVSDDMIRFLILIPKKYDKLR